jgi:hypothetical protein
MLLVTSSCLFDPEEKPIDDGNDDSGAVQRLPLTTREAVLNNIEYAYDTRTIDAYDELLDLNFTFFFSDGDVGGGLPVQWPRTDELGATNDLFISNSQSVPVGPPCKSIRMDLTLENLQWVEIIPEDYPGETWYMTPINYEFTFKMDPDDTYNSEPGAKGQFTVRNAGTEAEPHWQLVEWKDLGNDN